MLINEKFDNGKAFDWGLTSEDYAKFRDIYPDELYARLKELGVATDGTEKCYRHIPINSQLSTRRT